MREFYLGLISGAVLVGVPLALVLQDTRKALKLSKGNSELWSEVAAGWKGLYQSREKPR